MVIFKLSMPKVNTWNGRWSGEDQIYAKCMPNNRVPEDIIGKSFSYNFGDGWFAKVEVEKMDNSKARRIMSKSQGFCGYDWMIRSIIKNKKIVK